MTNPLRLAYEARTSQVKQLQEKVEELETDLAELARLRQEYADMAYDLSGENARLTAELEALRADLLEAYEFVVNHHEAGYRKPGADCHICTDEFIEKVKALFEATRKKK